MQVSTLKEKLEFIAYCHNELEEIFPKFLCTIHKGNDIEAYEVDLHLKEMSYHFYNQLWSNTGCGWTKKK